MRLPLFPTLLAALLLATPAVAQQRLLVKLSSGTGFFVNQQGHIITNAHVVKDCKSIVIHLPKGDLPATLAARDERRDLAVLKVNDTSPSLASLRWNIDDLKLGDEVVLLGYPGREGVEGHSTFVKTSITGLIGPNGETGTIQLAPAAAKGNSGGPVLDASGNVIAVITGTAQTFRADASGNPTGDPIKRSDVAITLAALQDFLRRHYISFYEAPSNTTGYGDKVLEQNASRFIVPIRCIQGTTPAV